MTRVKHNDAMPPTARTRNEQELFFVTRAKQNTAKLPVNEDPTLTRQRVED